MICLESGLGVGEEDDGPEEDGGGKDEEALSIFTAGFDVGFGSQLASHLASKAWAKRSKTSTIAVFLPQEKPAFSIIVCISSLSIFICSFLPHFV